MFYVYVYKHPETDVPFYVGKGSGNRMFVHLNETKDNTCNKLKYSKIESLRKQGLTPKIEIVFTSEEERLCYELEEQLILEYGRIVDGGVLTNMCIKAQPPSYAGSLPRSEEYLKNMSEAKRGEKNPMSSRKGEKSPFWGRKLTEAAKQKISLANSGRKYTEEEHKRRNATRGKTYNIIHPCGRSEVVANLKQWCLQNQLSYVNMREALTNYKGKTNYKGYTGFKL